MENNAFQKLFDNMRNSLREERMKTSPQLMLCELIYALKQFPNQDALVFFDDHNFVPSNIDSWRGSYDELAFEWVDLRYKSLTPMTVKFLLKLLQNAIGKTFTGYKGGEFVMGKNTPLWVANYSCSEGWKGGTQAVVGVGSCDDNSIFEILTEEMEY